MFPYKVRKPAWGTLKPKESLRRSPTSNNNDAPLLFDATSQLGGDPTDPHTVGGNLQRAILLDLIELRHRYCCAENNSKATTASASSQQGGIHKRVSTNKNYLSKVHNHPTLGSSFARFKECFRNARFGAIHTRTIPPRVDRGEYVQLLYSSCFYLLEESFKSESDSDSEEPLRWDVIDTSHSNCAFNAIFAAFILYTLHQTNILPEAPPPRSQNVIVQQTKPGDHHQHIDEQLLKESWSMLPIGFNSDEDKLYRRKFRSPVRIDRWNYLLLLRLRELCLAQVEQYGLDAKTNSEAGRNSTCNNNTESWRCHCGIARDAAYIIDKMLETDSFFEYCEYHGPHSLEGLAGSSNFYRAYFASSLKKKSTRSKKNVAVASSTATLGMTASELNSLGNDDEDSIPSSFELQKLVEQHCSNLASVSSHLQKSRLTGSELQPKQRELVENTLNNMLDPSKYSVLLDKLNDKGANPSISNGDQAELPCEENATKTPEVHLLSFPDNFSKALRSLLLESFADFKDEAKSIREAVVKENKVRSRDKSSSSLDAYVPPDVAIFDDLYSTTATDAQTLITVERRARRPREHDDFLELQQEEFDADEISIATGEGKNALLSLLSASEGNELPVNACMQDDQYSIATGAGKNALRALLSMAGGDGNSDNFDEESMPSDDDQSELQLAKSDSNDPKTSVQVDDAASVVSGMGMRALNLLLSGQAGQQKSQTTKIRLRRNTKQSPPKKAAKKSTIKKGKQMPSKKNPQPGVQPLLATQPNPNSNETLPDDGSCARDNDDEESLHASTTTGKSSDEEMSVVTEDAGRNALAKLLSNTK
ncbi:hypothetical protein ACHAWU_005487 [Discostella pseudostelligera]|uniref:Uncharacterized protein n=1 Tax=Discostella pseudostelligera TaxID=259834 RepID=A0ABD3MXH7_9STRA